MYARAVTTRTYGAEWLPSINGIPRSLRRWKTNERDGKRAIEGERERELKQSKAHESLTSRDKYEMWLSHAQINSKHFGTIATTRDKCTAINSVSMKRKLFDSIGDDEWGAVFDIPADKCSHFRANQVEGKGKRFPFCFVCSVCFVGNIFADRAWLVGLDSSRKQCVRICFTFVKFIWSFWLSARMKVLSNFFARIRASNSIPRFDSFQREQTKQKIK